MKFDGLKIVEDSKFKLCSSSDYNYVFDKNTGFFARWGATKKEDPEYAPSPEILDIEISSGGDCKGHCRHCYKKNGITGEPTHNMTFDEFKVIFHKVNSNNLLTQIAFGIMNISTNQDFFKMMEYSRQHGVIPNYTCHGLDMTPEYAKKTSELCGAVAVSFNNKEKTYDTIKMLTDLGMTQINIHYVLALESYDNAFKVIDDISSDPRLKKMNAIVFLQYKHKNEKSTYHSVLDVEKYKKLMEYCEEKKIRYGMDSCSASIYTASIKDHKNREQLETYVEPCESFLMSFYINCKGIGYPCSFSEDIEDGIDVLHCNDFLKDIWDSKQAIAWRKKLLKNKRNCPVYNLKF